MKYLFLRKMSMTNFNQLTDMQQLRMRSIDRYRQRMAAKPIQLKVWQCAKHQDKLRELGLSSRYSSRCLTDIDCPYCTIDILEFKDVI